MASPPQKFNLKSTTKISLNERFTAYREQAQLTAESIRQKLQQQQQASVKNRRLAQQMANRPSVIAALKLKKKSLKQRLGQPPSSFNTSNNVLFGGGVKSRLYFENRPSTLQNRLGNQRSTRGRNKRRRSRPTRMGTSPILKGRLGSSKFLVGRSGIRSGGPNFRRGGGVNNTVGSNSGGQRNRGGFRGFRNRRSRGRGGSNSPRNWRNSRKPENLMLTKQELDLQLEEYMSQTKASLDAELDSYMAVE